MTSSTSARRRRASFPDTASRRGFRIERLEDRRLLAAGALDPSFGNGGTVVTDMTGRIEALAAEVSVAAPDGKLLVAGQTRGAGGADFALARYHADGSLDRSFGDNGRVVTDINAGSWDEIADADVLGDGRIVVAGTTGDTPYHGFGDHVDFVVARYRPDGSLDTSFGGDGVVVTDLGGRLGGSEPVDAADVAAAVSLAPGGKLVVAGWTGYVGGADVAVVRYNADGSLDESFGQGGVVKTNVYPESDDGEISPSDDAAGDVYVHPDGRILVGGRARGEFLLIRYLPDGRIDRTFGRGHGPDYLPPSEDGEYGGDPGDPGDGFVTTRFPGSNAGIVDFAVSGGRIVAAGSSVTSLTSGDFAVAVYDLRNGNSDRGFSGDGKTTIDFAGGRDEASAVLVRRDGTVFVAGYATTPNTLEDFALARLDARGRRVASFGSGGKLTTDFGTAGGPTFDRSADATFTADGRIVLAGPAGALPGGDFGTSGLNFGIARYLPGGSLDTTFGAAGKVTTPFLGSVNNYGGDAILQRDGKLVVGGYLNGVGGLQDIVLARYNPDGSLDATFGNGGFVTTDLSADADGRSSEGVSAMAIDHFGRIVIAGATDRRNPGPDGSGARRWDLFVARYWPSGMPDRTLGNGAGFVVTDLGNADEYPVDVAIAPNGRIVVAGETRGGGQDWPAIVTVRYLMNGSLDASFAGDGIVTTDLPGPVGEHAGGVAVQGDGRVVVAGSAWEPGTGQNFALLRYAVDGSLDPTFGGGDGWLTTDFGGYDSARAVTIQPDGRILVAGEGQVAHSLRYSDMAVARYLPSGALDLSFNGTGRAVYMRDNADRSWDAANDVQVQPDGKVVLVGVSVLFPNATPGGSGPGRADFAAVRLRADGTVDTDFGAAGLALVHFDGFAVAQAGAIDPVRGIVLAGDVSNDYDANRATGGDFAVARLLL